MNARALVWLLPILILGFWLMGDGGSPHYGEGVLVAEAPQQTNLRDAQPFMVQDFKLTPRADFSLEARVLSQTIYRFDAEAKLSPVDLALGWQRMSDSSVLEHINISQRGRFYYWRVREYPIPHDEIVRSSANMHMIPATPQIERELRALRRDEVIRLQGQLVDVDSTTSSWRWRTSMVRTDSGGGACEIVYVTGLERIM